MDSPAYSEMVLVTMARTSRRLRRLRSLGVEGGALGVATSSRGAWHVAKQPALHTALSNAVLLEFGFLLQSNLAPES